VLARAARTIFRGFALMARRDIFSIGDCASPNLAPKRQRSGLITSAVFVDFNIADKFARKPFLTS
jgi:hypothetical protein